MRKLSLIAAVTISGILIACNQSPSDKIVLSAAERIAQDFSVTIETLTNYQGTDTDLQVQCKNFGGGNATCSTYRISLTNPGAAIAPSEQGWALYFHHIRRNLALLNNKGLLLEHVNGDLHRLTPNEHFAGIPSGATLELDLLVEKWMLFESDFMPRLFVVDDKGKALVIASTDSDNLEGLVRPINKNHPYNWKRTKDDANILASAASRYRTYTSADTPYKFAESENWRERIIPTPLSTTVTHNSLVSLPYGIELQAGPLKDISAKAFKQRLQQLQLARSGPDAYLVRINIDPKTFDHPQSGSYRLHSGPSGATISGFDQTGAFYGLQSLIALVDAKNKTLVQADVEDAPRFPHRGMFLDVGRNFHSKEVVLKLLEQMAAYKLNRFHFHLSDDEGWRLEVPGLPELTEVGSKRCFDLSESHCLLPQLGSGPNSDNSGSGFFSVDDYIEIVRFAAARHIEVIPEFDMPAHARAALVAMEARHQRLINESEEKANEYRLIDPDDDSRFLSAQFYNDSYVNPCIESTYHFANKLIQELQAMHMAAGAPLATWHFGGDEAINLLALNTFENAPGQDPEKGSVPAAARQRPWSGSPQCQKLIAEGTVNSIEQLGNYFAKRISQLQATAGIDTMAAWYDGVKQIENANELVTAENYINSWAPAFKAGGEKSARAAEHGFQVVQSHSDHLYFDMPYEMDPKENGYYWASRSTDTRKTFSYSPINTAQLAEIFPDLDGKSWLGISPGPEFEQQVRGIQGLLWSETTRNSAMVEYKVFPRLLALAERAWHKAEWELPLKAGQKFSLDTNFVNKQALTKDWLNFAAAVGNKELFKLDLSGIGYRIPLPGAVVNDLNLRTATAFPGLNVDFFDGKHWQQVTPDTQPEAVRALRASSADGKRKSRSVPL